MIKAMVSKEQVSMDYAYSIHSRLSALIKSGRDDLRDLRNRIGRNMMKNATNIVHGVHTIKQVTYLDPKDINDADFHIMDSKVY